MSAARAARRGRLEPVQEVLQHACQARARHGVRGDCQRLAGNWWPAARQIVSRHDRRLTTPRQREQRRRCGDGRMRLHSMQIAKPTVLHTPVICASPAAIRRAPELRHVFARRPDITGWRGSRADRANADLTTIQGFSKMIRSAIRGLWQPSG